MLQDSSQPASSRLGVTTAARGKSACTSAPTVSWAISRSPLVATMTGSSTTLFRACRPMASATTRTTSGECSMPIFTASTPMSSTTASICARSISGGTPWMSRTPRVFCAVMAVMAVMP